MDFSLTSKIINLKPSFYSYVLCICIFLFITSSCQQKIDLREYIVDIDGGTGATPAYDPDRIIPPHLGMKKYYKPFMVDPDILNLAFHMPATASEDPRTGELEQLTDDIKTSGEFDFVGGPSWVQVDLEKPALIHAIVVWHYYRNADIFDDVIVSISDNVDFSGDINVLFNNDHDNSSGMGIGKDSAYISTIWGNLVDACGPDSHGTKARFIRVYSGRNTDGSLPRYLEVAAYGFDIENSENHNH